MLPLCSKTFKHCLLLTSQTLAVQSFDPDNNVEPSIDKDILVTIILKKCFQCAVIQAYTIKECIDASAIVEKHEATAE